MVVRYWISSWVLTGLWVFSRLFYRIENRWITPSTRPERPWSNIRLLVLLNHTSLYEPLFLGSASLAFSWDVARRIALPVADKTARRPLVGRFFRLLFPNSVVITRKRDESWREFMRKISPDSLVVMLPEGRMMRPTGLDAAGKPMTIRTGIEDVLNALDDGRMLICYSGGLHHVQAPGDRFPRLFKTIRMDFELVSIREFKAEAAARHPGHPHPWVVEFEERKAKNTPTVGGQTPKIS